MKIDKSTFCSAPWFQIRNENDMSKSVCCVVEKLRNDQKTVNLSPLDYLNSKEVIELKRDLTQGLKNPCCNKCWRKEELGIESMRNSLNNTMTHDNFDTTSWIDSYFKNKENFLSDMLISADIKIGNTCNHACVMCHPRDSSLIYNDWIKRQDSEFVQDALEKDTNFFKNIKLNTFKNKKYEKYIFETLENNKHIRHIKLLGGEPFLDKNLLKKLKNLDKAIKQRLNLSFVTNGSIDVESVLNYLGDFKFINCAISLEGIGNVQEWARYGSDWTQLEKNILNVRDKNLAGLSISHALQTSTVPALHKLLDWCKKYSIDLSCGVVQFPNYLSVSTLPPNLKDNIIASIEGKKEIIKVDDESWNHARLVGLIKDVKFDQTLFEKYIRYINWYEANKKIPKLQEVIPEWQEYFN